MTHHPFSLDDFFSSQLNVWADARKRFEMLRDVQTLEMQFRHTTVRLQHNPGRLLSTNSDMKKVLSGERPCFLCAKNRPDVQESIPFEGDFEILINPYPILPVHYTIACNTHLPQRILAPLPHAHDTLHALLQWVETYPELAVIYNGPRAGASAPDHLHLQAGDGSTLPLISRWKQLQPRLQRIGRWNRHCRRNEPIDAQLFQLHGHCCNGFAITYTKKAAAIELFHALYNAMQATEGTNDEPSMNLVAWQDNGTPWLCVFPRKTHRPQCFYAEDDSKRLISPGALDMAGQITVPRGEDFIRLTGAEVRQIYRDVCVSRLDMERIRHYLRNLREPSIRIGLKQNTHIDVVFQHTYCLIDPHTRRPGPSINGQRQIDIGNGKLIFQGAFYEQLSFIPRNRASCFTLDNVMIGKNFHWQQSEMQTFHGRLLLLPQADGTISAVNQLSLEQYLESVVSSEMSANAPIELLKAHAIIARSWAMRMIERDRTLRSAASSDVPSAEIAGKMPDGTSYILRWYDANGHTDYDVCADDHCQRYQGTGRVTPAATEAVASTRGQVLTYKGEICDTRYAKCCGGHTEDFATCWEEESIDYLAPVPDTDDKGLCFCQTDDRDFLAMALNNYDQATTDFFSWTETIPQDILRQRIHTHLGTDLGDIIALRPLQRGPGGHIAEILIKGTKGRIVVGKELEIRRMFSDSHLKSSNFTIDYHYTDGTCSETPNGQTPTSVTLHGHGWGHGVGLCQIGAAVMAHKGYTHEEILAHYYKGTTIQTLYP